MSRSRVWEDISKELWRTYYLPNGNTVTFNNPVKVGIKRTTHEYGGYTDSHVVECRDGSGGYVAEFEAIKWAGYAQHNANDTKFGERVNAALAE